MIGSWIKWVEEVVVPAALCRVLSMSLDALKISRYGTNDEKPACHPCFTGVRESFRLFAADSRARAVAAARQRLQASRSSS
jgi:hypothetical protein